MIGHQTKEKMENQERIKDNGELEEIRLLLPHSSTFSGLISLTFLAIETSLLASISISSITFYIIVSMMLITTGINLILVKRARKNLLKLINKLDLNKKDLGPPLIAGGTLLLVEAAFDLIAGVAAEQVAISGGAIFVGGKFVYDKVYGDRKKLEKAYRMLSKKLHERGYQELQAELDTAYDLFKAGLDSGGKSLKDAVNQCIFKYKELRNG